MEETKFTVEKIEEILTKEPYLGGALPTEADRTAFESLKETPDANKFKNAHAWYLIMKAFTPEVRMMWSAKKADKKDKKDKKEKDEGKDKKEKKEKKDKDDKKEKHEKHEKKEEKKPAEEDLDFFGEGDNTEAQKLLDEKKKKDEEAKKAKKKETAKSYIRYEVKVNDSATNLDQLADRIRKETAQDGLKWEAEHIKQPFAFGVEKLIISCVIEDDKVDTEELENKIRTIGVGEVPKEPKAEGEEGEEEEEEPEGLVQSVDILLFQKL